MNKREKEFISEFSTNFSNLYVESFLIRFLNNYDNDDLLEVIDKLNKETKKKIQIKFQKELNNLQMPK